MLPIGAALDCARDGAVVCPGRGLTGPFLPVLQEPLSLLTLCFVTATHPCVAGEVPLRKRASALVGTSERPLLALRPLVHSENSVGGKAPPKPVPVYTQPRGPCLSQLQATPGVRCGQSWL